MGSTFHCLREHAVISGITAQYLIALKKLLLARKPSDCQMSEAEPVGICSVQGTLLGFFVLPGGT